MAKQKIIDFDAYRDYFNDSALWDKIKNVAKRLVSRWSILHS